MIKEKFIKAWQSRIGFGIICFFVGSLCTYFFSPEKIKVEIKTEVKVVEKIVEKVVVQWKTKIEYVEKEVKKTTHTVISPDGTTTIDEIYESNESQVSRMEEQFKEQLATQEREWEQKYSYLMEKTNPRRLTLFGGIGVSWDNFNKPLYLGGFSYTIFKPFTIGTIVNSQGEVFGTVGIQF